MQITIDNNRETSPLLTTGFVIREITFEMEIKFIALIFHVSRYSDNSFLQKQREFRWTVLPKTLDYIITKTRWVKIITLKIY